MAEYEALVKALEGVDLNEEERRSLDELQQYLVAGEGSWVLGDDFLAFVGKCLPPLPFPSSGPSHPPLCVCRSRAVRLLLGVGGARVDAPLPVLRRAS